MNYSTKYAESKRIFALILQKYSYEEGTESERQSKSLKVQKRIRSFKDLLVWQKSVELFKEGCEDVERFCRTRAENAWIIQERDILGCNQTRFLFRKPPWVWSKMEVFEFFLKPRSQKPYNLCTGGAVTEPFPMKRELKDKNFIKIRFAHQCYRTIPYEEGTESIILTLAAEPKSFCYRTIPYEEGTERSILMRV
ncbi:MAG: hypothetical protein Q8O04_09950 [Deltaproteobacteria bacterium]|nr:hypothetical protein [Deltaproteobacteria bacterium]